MKFEEVLSAFKEGRKIKRKCWVESNYLQKKNPNMGYLYILNADYIVTADDLEADDWEVIDMIEHDKHKQEE